MVPVSEKTGGEIMYPVMKTGEKFHFISDREPGQPGFEANLLIQKELYQNGR